MGDTTYNIQEFAVVLDNELVEPGDAGGGNLFSISQEGDYWTIRRGAGGGLQWSKNNTDGATLEINVLYGTPAFALLERLRTSRIKFAVVINDNLGGFEFEAPVARVMTNVPDIEVGQESPDITYTIFCAEPQATFGLVTV